MEISKLSQVDQENWKKIFAKCHEDATFKQELIANPVAALEKLADKEINQEGFKLVVTDQSDPSTVYINIPSNDQADDLQLTEEQLEFVAGGSCFISAIIDIF